MNKRLRSWGAVSAVLALLAVAGAAGAQSAAGETPYLMLSDPLPPNPAAFPWRVVVLTGGPVAAEIASTHWSVGDVAGFVSGLTAGAVSWGDLTLGDGEIEELSWVGAGRAQVNVAAFQLSYGLMTNGSGSLPEGFVRLMRDASAGEISLDSTYSLDGTKLQGQAWQDLTLRANAPVPILPRLFGLRKLSIGAGVHLLKGVSYFGMTGEGTVALGGSSEPPPKVTFTRSSQARGQAFDVGVVASLSPRLSVEAAYVGAGALNWTGVERATVDKDNLSDLGSPANLTWDKVADITYELPAVGLVGLHLRPLPLGVLELSAYYAEVGVNQPETERFRRLQGEASVSALGLLRASLGAAKDSNEEQARLYGSVDVGLGGTRLTVRAANLQEISQGTQAKSLGVALMASVGF